MRTVFIEESKTPIYLRIAQALGAELVRHGFQVMMIKPDGFNTLSFHEFVSKQSDAAYISTSVNNAIQHKITGQERYFFEQFPGKVIFLHQDAILGGADVMTGISKLQAWQRVASRTAHLCIEPDNVVDLHGLGIQAKVVPHATEIEATEPSLTDFEYEASFVGHVVPSLYLPTFSDQRVQALVDGAVKGRQANLFCPIEPLVKSCSEATLGGLGTPADQAILKVAAAQWLRSQVTSQTMPFRGWVFENSGLEAVTIFGGDPAYLHRIERNLRIDRPGVSYQPAVYEPNEVRRVFNKSKININISSMQFDHAVVNRFHDVTMAGGLCLTDARSGLAELTSAHEEVSYNTLQELHDRALHFSKPENAQQRALLIKRIQQDIAQNSGYGLLVKAIIATLDEL